MNHGGTEKTEVYRMVFSVPLSPWFTYSELLLVRPRAEFFELPLQGLGRHPQLLGRRPHVAVRAGQGLFDPVLGLPLLDHPVQRPLTDPQELGRLLPVPDHFQGPLRIVPLDLTQRPP